MKHLVFVLTLFFFFFRGEAQSFVIHDQQGNNVTSLNAYVNDDACAISSAVYYVINASASAKTVKVYRTHISLVAGTYDAMIYDLIGYAPSIDTSVQSVTIQSGDSVYFEPNYFANCIIGTSIIRYCFFDVNNPSDQSCYTSYFSGVVIGVSEVQKEINFPVHVFPVPSNGLVYCQFPFSVELKSSYVISDFQGKQIEAPLIKSTADFIELNFEGLADGIYFIRGINAEGNDCFGKIQIVHE